MVKKLKKNESFPVITKAGFEITFPDLITALNLCAGIAAIFSAIKGEITVAIVLVAAGMLFDYFDGKIARAYNLAHDFGRELDSLADVVTFGVAPGVILLTLYPGDDLVLAAAAIYAVAAAFRLARFNLLKTGETVGKSYAGIPVPVAAFVLLAVTFIPLQQWVFALVALLMAALMVSTIKVPKW
ncbi:CDP-diacylglycerol--serine O-phosphatidyltransferase [Candidatus Woesearchaeota archaeon]|nr:CDP-diacylglycerol--serine O-phosphatidyltransferase [Candidatus Woesearchaeota archaeon]